MDDTEMTSPRMRRRGLRLFVLGLTLLLIGLVILMLTPYGLQQPQGFQPGGPSADTIGILTAVSGFVTSVAGLVTSLAALRTKRNDPPNVKKKKGQRRR